MISSPRGSFQFDKEGSITSRLAEVNKKVARIGVAEGDHDQVVLQKQLLVFSSVMIGGSASVWGLVYLAFGEPLAASIPLTYAALSSDFLDHQGPNLRWHLRV